MNDDFRILQSGDGFLWSSWRDGQTQLYLYSFDKQNPLAGEAKLERQLTQGDFEMLGVEGLDESSGTVFSRPTRTIPAAANFFRQATEPGMQPLTHEEGTSFGKFSEDGKHYELSFSGPVTTTHMSLCTVDGGCSPIWVRAMKSPSTPCALRSSWSSKRKTAKHCMAVYCSSTSAGQWQNSADREYLWRACGADGFETTDQSV